MGYDEVSLIWGLEMHLDVEKEGVSGWNKVVPVAYGSEELKFEPNSGRDMRGDTCIGATLEGG